MNEAMFDLPLRAARRDRAARMGAELFLFDRLFDDLLDRLSLFKRQFGRTLLIGCPSAAYRERLEAQVKAVDVADPGALFAAAAGGSRVTEETADWPVAAYDLCIAFGTLDTVNDLPTALQRIRFALAPDGLLLGVMSGGQTLPLLRAAMRAADEAAGAAAPHVHPRLAAPALSSLLGTCGFHIPVVDIDRADVRYPSLDALVRDLRAMAATNLLAARVRRPLTRPALAAARAAFAAAGSAGRAVETFEFLHFAAWTPGASKGGPDKDAGLLT